MDKGTMIEGLQNHPLYARHRQIIMYALIGGISACLDFSIYSLLTIIFHIDYLIANIISVHGGIICSFWLNRQFNFKVKDRKARRFLSFYLVGLGGLLLSSILLKLMIEILYFNELASKFSTIFFVAGLQFLLNKFISFKQ